MRIGIDVGGTKISAVLWKDKVIKKKKVSTPKTKKAIIAALKKIIAEFDSGSIEHIGIGVPGTTDGKIVLGSKNLPMLNHIDLSKELNRPITLLNDANAFAIAEATIGAAKNKKHVIGLIVGTGIGSGIIINKKIHLGNSCKAGEVGQIRVSPFTDKTYESEWAGPSLEKMYEELTGKKARLSDIAKKKSQEAKSVVAFVIEGIAYICSVYTRILNPEVIVLGGGVSNLKIYAQINKRLKELAGTSSVPKVVKNKLGPDAGVIGAAII